MMHKDVKVVKEVKVSRRMKIRVCLAAILLAASVAWPVAQAKKTPAAELADAEARWQARKPKAYEFSVLLSCQGCSHANLPSKFRVQGYQPVASPKAGAALPAAYDAYGTIERLFARIRRAIADGGYKIEVKYDADLGYPIWANLDPRRDIIDDELFFRVTNFRQLAVSAY